jgi:hypothetical protein
MSPFDRVIKAIEAFRSENREDHQGFRGVQLSHEGRLSKVEGKTKILLWGIPVILTAAGLLVAWLS